ncbi:MAG: hypothetical protein DMC59_07775 [Verrucomicrobia bacterium]|nr:MAG: hypothetical protein DMC59_07775 [Verrucomicrobiota bacterium]
MRMKRSILSAQHSTPQLPLRARRGNRTEVYHLRIDTFREVNACFKVERIVLNALAKKCVSGAEFLVSAATLP